MKKEIKIQFYQDAKVTVRDRNVIIESFITVDGVDKLVEFVRIDVGFSSANDFSTYVYPGSLLTLKLYERRCNK